MADMNSRAVNLMNGSDAGKIRSIPVDSCYLCGADGSLLYGGLKDRLFNVMGEWSLVSCTNHECGLVWLNPKPLPEEIGKLYVDYCTHTANSPAIESVSLFRKGLLSIGAFFGKGEASVEAFVGSVRNSLALFGPRREMAEASIMWLSGKPTGRLLDVGCGSGHFLKQMRASGWEVFGVEPDPKAVAVARDEYDMDVRQGDLASVGFDDDMFDAITLSHVIEHVPDPAVLLSECRRVLKPGGSLVVTTPNMECLCHTLFKESWLDLDPPRHLYIFSALSIKSCASKAGIQVMSIKTCSRLANSRWFASMMLKDNGRIPNFDIPTQSFKQNLQAKFFHKVEYVLSRFRNVGEEIVLIGTKR